MYAVNDDDYVRYQLWANNNTGLWDMVFFIFVLFDIVKTLFRAKITLFQYSLVAEPFTGLLELFFFFLHFCSISNELEDIFPWVHFPSPKFPRPCMLRQPLSIYLYLVSLHDFPSVQRPLRTCTQLKLWLQHKIIIKSNNRSKILDIQNDLTTLLWLKSTMLMNSTVREYTKKHETKN